MCRVEQSRKIVPVEKGKKKKQQRRRRGEAKELCLLSGQGEGKGEEDNAQRAWGQRDGIKCDHSNRAQPAEGPEMSKAGRTPFEKLRGEKKKGTKR